MKREASFKVDKEYVEEFKMEMSGKIHQFTQKANDRDSQMSKFMDGLESKVEQRMHELTAKMNNKMDEISNGRSKELVQRIVSLSEMMQTYQKDSAQQIKNQNNTINNIKSKMDLRETENSQRDELFTTDFKSKMKDMVRERENDLQMIQVLVEKGHKKILKEITSQQINLQNQILGEVTKKNIETEKQLKEWTQSQMDDKVRVDEVQDALKKITDSLYSKITGVQESTQ